MVVLFQQDAENRDFFSNFSADGLHDGRTLLVIPLEFQEIKHQPFPMAQPAGEYVLLHRKKLTHCGWD